MYWLQINWSAFSWDAFATLATGLAAVFAAWRVGNRQVALLAEQQNFVNQQAEQAREIKLQELRISLIDRRSECIHIMRELTDVFFRNARLERDQWPNLTRVLNSSRLIFPIEISDDIGKILDSSFRSQQFFNRSTYYRTNGNDEKADEFLDKAFEEEDQLMQLMPKMVDRLEEYTRV